MQEIQFGQVIAGKTFELSFPKEKFSDVDFEYARASCPKCIKTVVTPSTITLFLTPNPTPGPTFKLLNLYNKAGDQVNEHTIVVRWKTL